MKWTAFFLPFVFAFNAGAQVPPPPPGAGSRPALNNNYNRPGAVPPGLPGVRPGPQMWPQYGQFPQPAVQPQLMPMYPQFPQYPQFQQPFPYPQTMPYPGMMPTQRPPLNHQPIPGMSPMLPGMPGYSPLGMPTQPFAGPSYTPNLPPIAYPPTSPAVTASLATQQPNLQAKPLAEILRELLANSSGGTSTPSSVSSLGSSGSSDRGERDPWLERQEKIDRETQRPLPNVGPDAGVSGPLPGQVQRPTSPPPAQPLKPTEAASVVDKIDRTNTALPTLTQPSPAANTCQGDCSETPANPRFETCNDKNSYFEEQITSSELKSLSDGASDTSILNCVAESMTSVDVSKFRFVSCPRSGTGYGVIVDRPCASQRMTQLMANSFDAVTDCLASYVDSKAVKDPAIRKNIRQSLFQLANQKSAWFVNSIDNQSAGGVAHLVAPIIANVNGNENTSGSEWKRMQAHINSSKLASCQKIAKLKLEPLSNEPVQNHGCDRIALDRGNPVLNMLYMVGQTKSLRDHLAPALASVPSPTRERLLDHLMIWGYTAGAAGVSEALKIALEKSGAAIKTAHASEAEIDRFLDEMKAPLANWQKKNRIPGAKTRTEFLTDSRQTLANIEARTNGKCVRD